MYHIEKIESEIRFKNTSTVQSSVWLERYTCIKQDCRTLMYLFGIQCPDVMCNRHFASVHKYRDPLQRGIYRQNQLLACTAMLCTCTEIIYCK